MARGDRTVVENSPIVEGVIALLAASMTGALQGRVAEWERPSDANKKWLNPPYVLVREYPSAGQFNGPISDSKVDTILRIQVLALGDTAQMARRVRDRTRPFMQRNALEALIPDRAVMDLSLMVSGGGDTRDDDTNTGFFSSNDLYELWTTPQQEGS